MPGSERIDQIIDLDAAQGQVSKLTDMLTQVDNMIKQTNQMVAGLGTGGGAQSQSALAAQTQQITQANQAMVNMGQQLAQTAAQVAAAQKMHSNSIEENVRQLVRLQNTMDSYKQSLKEDAALVKDGTIKKKEYQQRVVETTQKISELKIKTGELNSVLKAQQKEQIAVNGSMDDMSQRLGLLRNAYRSLSEEQRNSDTGKAMLVNIQQLDTQVKELDASIGNYQRNVGNYSSTLTGWANALRGLRGPTKLLGEALGFSATAADQLRLVIEHSFQGLAALFRGQEKAKAAAEAAATATAAQATATEAATVAAGAEAVVMDGVAASTEAATAATTSFTAAFASTGIGALIIAAAVAVGLLVEAIYSWVTADKHAIEAEKELAEAEKTVIEARGKGIEDQKKYNDIRKRALEDELTAAEKSGASQEKIFALKKKIAEFDLNNSTHIANANEINNDTLNETIGKYTDAKNKVDYYNRAIVETDKILKSNAGKSWLSRNTKHQDVDDLKKKRDAAKAEMEQLEADKNLQIGVLEDQANAKRQVSQNEIEHAKFTADERRKIALESVLIEADLNKAHNAKVLADENSTQAQKIAAIKSNAATERAVIEAQKKNVLNNPSTGFGDRTIAIKKAAEEQKKVTLETNTQVEKINDEYRKRDFIASQNILKSKIELEAATDMEIVNDKRKSYLERMKAFEDYQVKQVELLELARQSELRKEGLTASEIESINKTHQDKVTQLQQKAAMERIKLRLEEINAVAKAAGISDEIGAIDAEIMALERLHKQYKNGKITIEEYNRQKEKIADTALLTSLKAQEGILLKQRAGYKKMGEDTQTIDLEIAKNRKRQQEIAFKEDDKDQKSKLDKFKKTFGEIEGIARQVGQVIASAMDAKFTEQKNRIQSNEDAQQIAYEKEVDNIQKSGMAEKDKSDKLHVMEVQRKAQKDANNREQKRVDMEKAKFDKQMAMFNIVLNTAAAVVKALPNIPLSIAAGVIGAAEFAVAAAAPIPKYAKGRQGGPAEWALTDEKGPEMYIEPSGKTYLGNDRPTMRYLKAGTKIIPADQVNEAMNARLMQGAAGMYVTTDNTGKKIDELKDMMQWQTGKLASAYKERKAPVVNIINQGGWSDYLRRAVKE